MFKNYSIKDAAKILGVAAVTLRLWERQGKITSSRTIGGQRRYSPEDITCIRNLINQPRVQSPATPPAPRPKLHLSFPQKHVLYGILVALMISAASFTAVRSGLIPSPAPLISNLQSLISTLRRPSAVSTMNYELSTINGAAGAVLASQTTVEDLLFKVNIPSEFVKDITAPNVLYSLKAGDNITVTGGQNPTISATDQTTDLKIFKNIKVGSNTISAGSKTDTLELAAGDNVTLSTSDKKVTIAATKTDVTTSGWTDDGTILRLTTAGDIVSIGTATGAAKLAIDSDTNRDVFTASQSGNLLLKLTNTGLFNLAATGFSAGLKLQNNATFFSSTGVPSDANGANGDYYFRSDAVAGSSLYVKVSGSWATSGSNWQRTSGVLSPLNIADDLILGATATSSALFQVKGTTGVVSAGTWQGTKIGEIYGGTNQTSYTAGDILYASAANTLAKLGVGTDGQTLVAVSGVPTWVGGTGSGTAGWIQRNSGVLSPSNITDDLTIGGIATSSAKFQVFGDTGNIITTGTANITGVLTGQSSATISGALTLYTTPTIASTGMQSLTLGNASTGNIVLAPGNITALTAIGNDVTIVDGLTVGGDIAVNGGDLTSSATSFNLLQSTATTINFGGAATTLSIGAGTGTATINNANTVVSGDLAVNGGDLTTSATTFNFVTGATTLNIGATTGTTTINNDLTIGNAITDAITFTGRVAADSDLVPIDTTGTNDLGSSSLPWDNLYVTNVFPNGTSGTIGWWQRNAGVLSPLNITDDLTIGATATASAKFQVFADTGSATTAGNLTFDSAGTIQTTKNQTLTIGGTSTGNINLPGLTASKVAFTDANKNLTSSGTVAAIQGGTGFSSYVAGQLLYADTTTTLAQRTVGSTGQVLIVSGGLPTWGSISGGSGCTDCVLTDPTSTQTILPTGVATTGLRIAQASGGTADVFSVTNFGSTSKYLAIQSDGTATAAGSLTLFTTPTIAATAMKSLTLGDTNTGNIQIGSTNTLVTPAFKLTTTPGSGYALISDANGVGSWTDVTTTGNLGPWTLSGSSLFPDSAAYNLLIGSATTADDIGKFTVSGTKTGKALAVFNDTGTDQNLLTASASGVTKFTVDHNGLISTASVDSTSIVNASIANADLANSSVTINSGGILTGGGAVSLGGTLTLTATEADTLASVTGRGATTSTLTTFSGGLTSSGAVTGKALNIFNETGDQNILVASASGTTVMTLGRTGNLSLTVSSSSNADVNLSSTGDFTISDAGTPYATFTDAGVFTLDSLNFDGTTIGLTTDTDLLSLAANALTVNGDLTTTTDIAINGGDLTSTATTFNLLNATVTTLNLGGAATTVSLGAGTGTTTVNNALTTTGTLTANGTLTVNSDTITLGNAITDAMTFTGRVALDSDLIPIGTTGTNDLGASALPWDNLYVNNVITDSTATGQNGYWTRSAGVLSPAFTNDVLAATTSATVAMTITQTGAFNALLVEDAASDTTPFVIDQSGNVGIGTTGPSTKLEIGGNIVPALYFSGTTAYNRLVGNNGGNYYMGLSTYNSGTTSKMGLGYTASPTTIVTDVVTIQSDGNVGIGTTGPDAKLDSLATTEQLRLTYTDGTVYSSFTTDSSGNLTIDNTGTKTVIADDLQINGGDILDSGGNEYLRFTTTASAVNELTLTNAAAAGIVTLAATGSDTDIALSIDAKGSDALNLNNTGTGDILIGGGSGSTGCTITNSTGALVCAGAVSGSNLSGTNTGDLTLSAIGSTPNANGMTLVGQALNLQPADGTYGGIVSTTTQTFAGTKTLTSPAVTTSLTTGSTTFALVNTTATTVNFAGAATALNIGATTGTTTIANAASVSGALTLYGTPTIASTAMQTLNLGGTTTGNIQLAAGSATPAFVLTTAGQVGIGTTGPDAALEINHATGDSLRLTYNDSNGSATNYTDFSLSATGELTLTGSAATLGASATAEKTFLTLTPGIITLTAPTAVTSLMETVVFTGATIAADAATTVNKATTLSLVAPIDSTNATITDASALRILNVTSGAGVLTNQYGIYVDSLTAGATANYGLYVAGGDIATLDNLWVGATAETIANVGFALDGNDAFISGMLGVEGDIYTDGDVDVAGGDVTTANTTATLFNTNATTLSLGGAATTLLDIGNGTGNYTAINIGSGIGTHVINIAGTGATAADTVNIGTGGTGADTITIGNSASTTSLALTSGTGSQTFTSSNILGVTTASSFVFADSALTVGTGMYVNQTSTPIANTATTQNLFNTTYAQGTNANTAGFVGFGINFTDATTVAGNTEYVARIQNQASTGSPTDNTVASLLVLDNADTATGNLIAVTDGLLVTNSGAATAGIVNGITVGSGTQPITNAFKVGSTGVTTDITLQNAETIDNDTDGTVNIGTTTLKLTGGTTLVSDQATVTAFDTTTTSLSLGGAATTLLNLGNGSGNYTAINLGSGAGTHVINIAGTGATAADTVNIGTGGTGADTINLGSSASTTALNFTSGTGAQTFASSMATGNAFAFTANSLSTGLGLYLSSTSTALSSGSLASLDWSPGSATTATGDLLKLNIGANGLIGNIFNVLDNGSSIFSVSQTAITNALPASFTAAGDVSLAYDLLFTNQTASYLKSNGPLYLNAGETWESNDLTFQTYNAGNIIANTQALAINGAATISGNLLVTDSQTATSSAFIANTNTAAGIVGLGIKLSSTTLDTTSRFINFLDKSGIVIGKINAANTTTVAYSANGTDMAEYFVKNDETFSPGDVVSASNSGLTKTSTSYDSKMIGIVSTAPSFVGGEDGANKVLVAIVGQVPVKIATSSPTIAKGDFVTSSIVAGRATKAVKPGFVIGKSLQDWDPANPSDQILVYVNNTWADPNNSLAFDNAGNLSVSNIALTNPTYNISDLASSLQHLESNIASISAQLSNLQLQNDPGSSLSAELWQYATESGKLTSIFDVQVPSLTVTGKLTVGLLSFDDLESSISSLTGTITVKGDLAVSGSIKVLGTSAGKAIIPAGSLDLSIDNSLASTTSAIFVTPEDPIAISGQSTQSGQFTVRIPQALPVDLKFQWWIVN